MPEQTLSWVEKQLGRGSRVISVRRMLGGSSTAVHAVDLRNRSGAVSRFVLRRFIRPNWSYPGIVRREAAVLECLEQAGYHAPRLIAFDDGPRETDSRALLMTRLPGRVELTPRDLKGWLLQMARELPAIHAIPATGVRRYRPYYDPRTREVPAWSKQPLAWRAVFHIASRRRPRTATRFIHRDYHPGNILWTRGRLTGVVDWPSACVGPPQVDVAHCRVNLVRLYGLRLADRFLDEYAAATSASVSAYDPYWDAMGLMDSGHSPEVTAPSLAPSGLTLPKMYRRLDAFAVAIARRG